MNSDTKGPVKTHLLADGPILLIVMPTTQQKHLLTDVLIHDIHAPAEKHLVFHPWTEPSIQ